VPTYSVVVNGQRRSIHAWDPSQPLLYALRGALGLTGAKLGCGLGQCGSCTVLVDDQAARACLVPVSSVAGRRITTVEGLGTPEKPDPLQAAFIAEQAAQCGYCLSGVILTAKAALDRNPRATDAELRRALDGVLCRCFGQTRMMRAIRRYADGVNA
jgi:nicotinate dehydrogenase subunit A